MSFHKEAEKLLEEDALFQGMPCWKRIFYKILPFAIVVGGILSIHGVHALINSDFFSNSPIPRPKKLSAIEQRVEIEPYTNQYTKTNFQSTESKTSENFLLYDEDELKIRRQLNAKEISSITSRRFTNSSFAEYSFSPRSTRFKIYAAALSKVDAEKPTASEAMELVERLMSPEDTLHKEGSVVSVLGESDSHYFVYLGLVSPEQVAEWAEQGEIPEDSKNDIEDFVQRFESIRTLTRENGRVIHEQSFDYTKQVSKAALAKPNAPKSLEAFLLNNPELQLTKFLDGEKLSAILNSRFQDSCLAIYDLKKYPGKFKIFVKVINKNEIPQEYFERLEIWMQAVLNLSKRFSQPGKTEEELELSEEQKYDYALSQMILELEERVLTREAGFDGQLGCALLELETKIIISITEDLFLFRS